MNYSYASKCLMHLQTSITQFQGCSKYIKIQYNKKKNKDKDLQVENNNTHTPHCF